MVKGPVLVTGGQGFVGRYVVQRLEARGDAVVEYNRDAAPSSEESPGRVMELGDLEDAARLVAVFERHRPRCIVHTAGQSHPALALDWPLGTLRANLLGTAHVLEAARITGVPRVVTMSSESAYGPIADPVVTEDARLSPSNVYGVTKASIDMLQEVYASLYGLDGISLRVSQVYGPGQKLSEDVGDAIRAGLRERRFALEHGADERLQLVYVEDVAEAIVCAVDAPSHRYRVYNVTGGSTVRLGDVVDRLRVLIPAAVWEIGPGTLGYDFQGTFSLERIREDLGWEPAVSLDEGLHRYTAWLRDHAF